MKKILMALCCLLSMTAIAQDRLFTVIGKVIDAESKQPLTGASAFCQNTTQGTISNSQGLFSLTLPNGGYDLAVSYTGYERKTVRISNNLPKDTLLLELAKENKVMEEVAVVASNEVADGWKKYGSFFTDNFIGTTPFAAQCQLQNPEVLHFFYTKKRNRLKVTTKQELVIVNYALGYRIRYQLDSFSYDYGTGVNQYTGSPLFEEMDSTAEVKAAWKKNRARTYLGSRLHFMRALYDGTADKEGFVVEKMDDNLAKNEGKIINNLYDSALYVKDSGVAMVDWTGRYRISYKSVYPDKTFLAEYKLPADTRAQVTILEIANDGFIIEQNGYFYEQYDVANAGYWAWKKLAESLPYDYRYE